MFFGQFCFKKAPGLYFAILGVGKRSLWCASFTDPPKPSGWYRKYIGNRTIEETSANQKILNTDVTRTDKTDWTIPILLSLLFIVVI